MTYTLVEPCAGSAAFTLFQLGAPRSLLPYQGSKWRFRHALALAAKELGFEGSPSQVILTDVGPWGVALDVVLRPTTRQDLLRELKQLAGQDPRAVFDQLHGSPAADDPILFTAQFLFLQRLAFSGKAVGLTKHNTWNSPGFNTTSAYGKAATNKFGAILPMVPSLIRVLEGYHLLAPTRVLATRGEAVRPGGALDQPTLVYIDPRYENTTAYPNGDIRRDTVVRLAQEWDAAGAKVIISEQEPIFALDWSYRRLYSGRGDSSKFRGQQEEWITFSPGGNHGP